MRLGDIANADAARYGKPLDGIRILALEQMQALPFATQLLARLGAEVIKVESPNGGDSGRAAQPGFPDPQGRNVGATFSRNNFNKRSICVDLKNPEGRQLVLDMVPKFDIVAENFKSGALNRMGLGYEDIAAIHPGAIYVSISGFGSSPSPYSSWPAYASVVEAMSGQYDYTFADTMPPVPSPMGALGDTATGMFAVIGILAALRHREHTGEGQHVDVAMLDTMVSMADIVPNFTSLGVGRGEHRKTGIMESFRASDGWFVLQVVREHQLTRLAELVGKPEWLTDERFAERKRWHGMLETDIRPAIDAWAGDMTRLQACEALSAAGLAAGPCFRDEEVIADPHVAAHNMLVELPRPDGGRPVLVPGNPIKMSKVAEGPETRVPWLGEHTDAVLAEELGLSPDELAKLHETGAIA
ncbi:MAG: putative acyl-CoA transferase/carnitine dehydratase [Actinomycetia bacterium]|nr:putative acyl-CoA transferase/carnitine dehydratase [Actinomycetes bacterium]